MGNSNFDFEAFKKDAIEKLREGKRITGSESVFQPLFKHLLETALEAEIELHMDENERSSGNRRNGKSRKIVKSSTGSFELETPRDRLGSFEPQVVGKRQLIISDELENKVLRLYGMGLSYQQLTEEIEELYGFEISPATLTSITDKIIPELNAWRNRDLDSLYCFVWLDALFYKVREDGRVINKAMYNIIGINANGQKDLLGIYIAETEGAAFWMQVLEDLKRRGIEDILIACIDNLKGFDAAITNVFPKTAVQSCVVHQIRNTLRYVPSKNKREFIKDLKSLYTATDKIQAEGNFKIFSQKWERKYPLVIDSWKNNWHKLTTFYEYPNHIRRTMYTTNIIEGFHRQVRRVTKVKSAFTNDMAFLKLVYLATKHITEKWGTGIPNWGLTVNQLSIYFPDRIKSDKPLIV